MNVLATHDESSVIFYVAWHCFSNVCEETLHKFDLTSSRPGELSRQSIIEFQQCAKVWAPQHVCFHIRENLFFVTLRNVSISVMLL